jgi:hypothetical protein
VTADPKSSRVPSATDAQRERGLRFIVETSADATARQVRASILPALLAGNTARDTITVEPLFPRAKRTDPPELRRMFLVTLPGVSQRDLQTSAFDIAYQMQDAAGALIAGIEPDLPHNVYDPVHDPASPLRARMSSLSGGNEPRPDDRYWHLRAIRAIEAWNVATPLGGKQFGEGISIGHPDTGWTRHLELDQAAIATGRTWDFVEDDRDATDPLNYGGNKGHGTKTGSVIISRGSVDPASDQLVGVAPMATLVPIRTIKSVVVLFDGDVCRAIDHAVRNGCHVISMSLGGLGGRSLEAAVNFAVQRNLLVLAAAGNEVGFVVAPAKYPNCIAVAGSNVNDRPWQGSSHGRAVDITAPGEQVWVANPQPGGGVGVEVGSGSGTSFAVACTAGVAALWLAYHGRHALLARYAGRAYLQHVFKHVLQQTARHIPGWDTNEFGPGIVNARAVLEQPLPDPADPQITAAPGVLRVASNTEHVERLFDDLPAGAVRARLAELLGTPATAPTAPGTAALTGAAPAAQADPKLERFAPELLHLLGTQPAAYRSFRRSITGRPDRTLPTAAFAPAAVTVSSAEVAENLADFASVRLARTLLRMDDCN